MTEVSDAVKVQVARAHWRADLLEFDAAEHVRIAGSDPSPTARDIAATATQKQAEATVHLDHADAAVALSIAKTEHFDDPKDPDKKAKYDRLAQAMTDLRMYWRGIGEATGQRRFVLNVDDFPEPTDEDVLATHGGSV